MSSLRAEPFDINPKFGGVIDHDNILDEFEGQGHRSMIKVARLRNVIFEVPNGLKASIWENIHRLKNIRLQFSFWAYMLLSWVHTSIDPSEVMTHAGL